MINEFRWPVSVQFALSPGRPPCMFWPEADRTGWHPYGNPDRSALAAMGIVELALHTHDILGAHHVDYRAPEQIVTPCLERIFPHTRRSDDPWHDLLTATGRTPETRGNPWRWDSTARPVT